MKNIKLYCFLFFSFLCVHKTVGSFSFLSKIIPTSWASEHDDVESSYEYYATPRSDVNHTQRLLCLQKIIEETFLQVTDNVTNTTHYSKKKVTRFIRCDKNISNVINP